MNQMKVKYARERAGDMLQAHIATIKSDKQYDGCQEEDQGYAPETTADLRRDVEEVFKGIDMKAYIKSWQRYEASYGRSGVRLTHADFDCLVIAALEELHVPKLTEKQRLKLFASKQIRIEKIRAEHDACMDLVVLGDESEALIALRAFAKAKV